MTERDAIVIGAGHNGLVCASYLARAGRKVLVLEAGQRPGGCAASREFAPGYSASACANWLYLLHPRIRAELRLERHGLELAASGLDTIGLAGDGATLTVSGAGIDGRRLAAADRAAFGPFQARLRKFAKLLDYLCQRRPPKLVEANLRDRMTLLGAGLGLRRLGRKDMREFLRVALSNIHDVLAETFEDELLQGVLALDAVLGSHAGPRSPNTVYGYIYRRLGDLYGYPGPAQVKGGMGGLAAALARAARSLGVELRTGAELASIDLEAGRARSVTLGSGETLGAALVVSSADPKTTFERLVGYRNIEAGSARRVRNLRMRGNSARLLLALDGLPEFTGVSAARLGQRLVIAPSMRYLEEAFNHAKYRECSPAPAMDISIPTVNDPGLAPAGRHVLSATVQYAPWAPKAGWEAGKGEFERACIATLGEYAPGIGSLVSASELLTPADLQAEYRVRGGHWHHGEIGLDQALTLRPFPAASQYATPVAGLYLCGAGSHPGGHIAGLAGRNAAREIIRRGRAA